MIQQLAFSARYGRPLIKGDIVANGNVVPFIGLIDSGADHCIFPIRFAELLGIEASQLFAFRGVTGSSSLFFEKVTLAFPFGTIQASVAFTAARKQGDYVLLGLNCFFDHARVTLDRRANVFTIEPC